MTPAGFPHSDIHGSTLESSSPWLFAGFHVLHRLLVPRHPPCALCSLTCCDRSRGLRSRKPPSDGSSPRFLSSPRTLLFRSELVAAGRRHSPFGLAFSPPRQSRTACRASRLDALESHSSRGGWRFLRLAYERLMTLVDGNVLLGSVAITCALTRVWRPSGGLVRLFSSKIAVFKAQDGQWARCGG